VKHWLAVSAVAIGLCGVRTIGTSASFSNNVEDAMDAELRMFLLELGIGVLFGTLVGLSVRRLRPDWQRRWQKFVLNRQWKLFTFGAILFGSGTVVAWLDGNIPYAVLSALLFLFEIFALFRYGFKALTPEMEQMIDVS
jgi:hypothetical protein